MTTAKLSIEERLTVVQVAIDNALADPSIVSALAAYGYTADRLQEGKLLRERLLTLHEEQKVYYGDLLAATDTLTSAQEQAHRDYMRCVKVARVALNGDRGAARKLGLEAERKRALSAWLFQARQFYNNALTDRIIMNTLIQYGITQERLEAGKRLVDAVEASNTARTGRKSAATAATRSRDQAATALDRWMGSFMKIARVALEDHPQGIEKLGVGGPA